MFCDDFCRVPEYLLNFGSCIFYNCYLILNTLGPSICFYLSFKHVYLNNMTNIFITNLFKFFFYYYFILKYSTPLRIIIPIQAAEDVF